MIWLSRSLNVWDLSVRRQAFDRTQTILSHRRNEQMLSQDWYLFMYSSLRRIFQVSMNPMSVIATILTVLQVTNNAITICQK